MPTNVEFKKLREFGEIVNDTFLFIRQNFKPLLKVYIYLCGFFLLAGMLAAIMHQLTLQGALQDLNQNPIHRLQQLFTINYLLVIIFTVANQTAITIAILCYITIYNEKGNIAPSVEEVWAYFKYYFFRVFGSSFIIILFFAICFLLCVLPGIYIFPAMSLFYPIMVIENGTFSYSFNRGFKLLRNQWWVTAGTIFVIWIIAYACISFASLPATIIVMFKAFTQGAKGLSTTIIIFSSILQYACQIFLIIPVIGVALCYFNLVERQESTGLLGRIDEFGQKKTDLNSAQGEY